MAKCIWICICCVLCQTLCSSSSVDQMNCKNTKVIVVHVHKGKTGYQPLGLKPTLVFTDQRNVEGGSQKTGNKCTEAWGVALPHACCGPQTN